MKESMFSLLERIGVDFKWLFMYEIVFKLERQ